MESPWTFWKSRKLKTWRFYFIAFLVLSLKYKWPSSLKWHLFPTYVPCLLFLHLCSSEWEFALKHSLRCWRGQRYFFLFSFYLDFVFILSWRVTSWNKKIISLQFSYLCFYQSHSYVYYGIPQSSGHSLLPAMIIMIKCPPDENVSSYFAWFWDPLFVASLRNFP